MFFHNRVFQITLLISLITHGVILFHNTNLNLFPSHRKEEKLEVSYIKEPQKPPPIQKIILPKKESFLKMPAKITVGKISPPPFTDNEKIKPAFIKPDVIAVKKKITLPPVDVNKISNPSYIGYYQIVREKIRRSAYQNYTRTEIGEVYLSFVISSEGYLKDMRLVEEKSSEDPYLRDIALKSIKEASPFPNFPKELDYPQLSFNVVISFEIE